MQQSSSLDFKLVQRVCLLQQALDQALGSLEELRTQVRDKQWIETQLAHTEKYANVQQQAIAQLKHQLAQFTEVQKHLLNVMGYRLNELIDHQQVEFSRLNMQFQQGNIELQTYLQYLGRQRSAAPTQESATEGQQLALEAEVMIARSMAVNLSQHLAQARQHLSSLTAALNNHHLNLAHIVNTVQAMIAELAAFETGIPLEQSHQLLSAEAAAGADLPLEAGELDIGTLQVTLQRQERRIQELEAVMRDQFAHQTQLRQRYQEIAAERDYYKRELIKAQQTAAMTDSQKDGSSAPTDLAAAPPPAALSMPPARRRSCPPPPIQPLKLPESLDL